MLYWTTISIPFFLINKSLMHNPPHTHRHHSNFIIIICHIRPSLNFLVELCAHNDYMCWKYYQTYVEEHHMQPSNDNMFGFFCQFKSFTSYSFFMYSAYKKRTFSHFDHASHFFCVPCMWCRAWRHRVVFIDDTCILIILSSRYYYFDTWHTYIRLCMFKPSTSKSFSR